jgi:hypothetical protein
MIVCPWPPGLPPPGPRTAGHENEAALLPSQFSAGVEQLTAIRLERAFQRLRRSFAKIGVPVVCAASGDPVRIILARLNQLRLVGMGRRK